MEKLTVRELRIKCNKLGISLTKSNGDNKLKKDLVNSLNLELNGGGKKKRTSRNKKTNQSRRSRKNNRSRKNSRTSQKRKSRVKKNKNEQVGGSASSIITNLQNQFANAISTCLNDHTPTFFTNDTLKSGGEKIKVIDYVSHLGSTIDYVVQLKGWGGNIKESDWNTWCSQLPGTNDYTDKNFNEFVKQKFDKFGIFSKWKGKKIILSWDGDSFYNEKNKFDNFTACIPGICLSLRGVGAIVEHIVVIEETKPGPDLQTVANQHFDDEKLGRLKEQLNITVHLALYDKTEKLPDGLLVKDADAFNKIFNWSFKGFRNMYHFTQIWGVLGFLKNNFCLAQLISGKQHIIICLGGGPTLNTEFKLLKDSNQMENLIIYVDNTLTRKYSAESTSLSDQWFADHKLNFVKLQ